MVKCGQNDTEGAAGMSTLWREKQNWKRLEDDWDTYEDILPYKRLYKTLTWEQLQELLRDAKRLHWEVLDLHRCGLDLLPEELGDLPDLRFLDVGNVRWTRDKYKGAENSFTRIPDFIGNLANLQSLNVSLTQLTALPDSIGNLANLQYLHLGSTKLTTLPDSIGNLANLRTLYLTLTHITALPDSIGNLANLQLLDVSWTQLTALPDSIKKLESLKTLDLSHCHLSAIPYSLVQLGLPFEIADVTAENCINLTNVTLDEGDISLFGQPREVIEEYYRNRVTETASECKVIFLGDGAAGKSSLIERMVNNTFAENSLPTDGVKLTRWTTRPDKDKTPLKLDGKPLVLRLMDFGGQEIMHAMHRCFLTAHTVYVIVCESRNDANIDSDALRWVETVQSFAPDCPVILALNKSDLNVQVTVDETALKAVNQNFIGAIRTSAKTDKDPGVKSLEKYIFDAVPGCLSQLTGNKGFLGLKQELEEMKEDYIIPEKFQERCNHFEIKETVRTDLLNWFRDLGVAYPYVVTFREVYVLNPAWLTNGIYRLILRTPPTGFLPHSVIRETLGTGFARDVDPDKTYTPQEMDFILHVMRQFEISLNVTTDRVQNGHVQDGVEMVPMKMEKNTPERVKDFPYRAALHLRWEAPYLPNTLVHRLMIRRHEDLDMDCVWRTGGWFHRYDGGCELLAVMSDRALDVYASGDDARGYMNTYREQILRILGELNIKAEEFVYCTVNGKTGRIPFRHVLARRRKGVREIYLGDIDEDVPVDWILRENYVEKPAHAERVGNPEKPVSMEMETRDFFISYNNAHDSVQARWIADTLRSNGYTVFLQEYDCKPGSDFLRWMEDAISHSRGFLAVWSGAYEESEFCKDELHAAKMKKHRDRSYLLLPVRVEDVPVKNPLFQSVVRVDLLSDEETNRARLLDAAGQVRR
ncbi:MAG: TIR domain-containing protein [Oscillibacter sp.]|nr:TIR domain-containing protein [Oscillibacter sp.]